jgi:signal peptide peptidase SppA
MLPPGPFAIYEPAARTLVAQMQAVYLHVHMAEFEARKAAGDVCAVQRYQAADGSSGSPGSDKKPYYVSDGVAVIPITGVMSKEGSPSLGGASTVAIRRQVRIAKADADVKAAVLLIDSPGGDVAGLNDLANDVKSFADVKPMYAYIEDLGASAAYWVASQCNAIYSNSNALIGSIGTMMAIADSSEAADKAGVKVHVLRSGEHKGIGEPGVPVSQANLDHIQSIVDTFASHFVSAVNRGRNLSLKAGDPPADGRVLVGAAARNAGLTDGVTSLDNVINKLKSYRPA